MSLSEPFTMGEVDIESDGGQMLLLTGWEGVYPWLLLRCNARFASHQSETVLEISWMSRPAPYGVG